MDSSIALMHILNEVLVYASNWILIPHSLMYYHIHLDVYLVRRQTYPKQVHALQPKEIHRLNFMSTNLFW